MYECMCVCVYAKYIRVYNSSRVGIVAMKNEQSKTKCVKT